MPWLPPPPENLSPAITCALIFFPDAEEYQRALFGQIAELTNTWNWEADRETQAIIRQVWLDAELQTLECFSMACLDDLVALLEEIRDKDGCCGSLTEAPGQDEIIGVDGDDIVTSDTDIGADIIPPEFEDVPDFQLYLCGAAVQIADGLPGLVDRTAQSIILASNALAIVTLIVLAFGNIIGMAIAATLAAGLGLVTLLDLLDVTDWVFDLRERILGGEDLAHQAQTKTELGTIRDDIRDAIACANDAAEATVEVHALLDANISDALYRSVLKLAASRGIMSLVFNGLVNAPDSNECSCILSGQIDGYAYTISHFTINGSTGSNTNITLQDQRILDSERIRAAPSGDVVVASQSLLTAGAPRLAVFGDLEARDAIVGDQETDITPTSGNDAFGRVGLRLVNGSTGSQVISTAVTLFQLFNAETGNWVSAVPSIVSADAGFTVVGNTLEFDDTVASGLARICTLDLSYE